MNNLPKGYHVIGTNGDNILVGMDFSHMCQYCLPTITYEGRVYNSGSLYPIPEKYLTDFCSVREYTLSKYEH